MVRIACQNGAQGVNREGYGIALSFCFFTEPSCAFISTVFYHVLPGLDSIAHAGKSGFKRSSQPGKKWLIFYVSKRLMRG
jgi:hypothetical protein